MQDRQNEVEEEEGQDQMEAEMRARNIPAEMYTQRNTPGVSKPQ